MLCGYAQLSKITNDLTPTKRTICTFFLDHMRKYISVVIAGGIYRLITKEYVDFML